MEPKYRHLDIDREKPVVFLDLCGVVNHVLAFRPWWMTVANMSVSKHDWADTHMIKLLGEIFRQTNTQIVIVSSWAPSFKGPEHETIRRIAKDLELDNVLGSAHTGGGDFRAQCILECVAEKKLEKYLIIDDAMPMYEKSTDLHDNLISPDGRWGITYRELDEIYITLNRMLGEELNQDEEFTANVIDNGR